MQSTRCITIVVLALGCASPAGAGAPPAKPAPAAPNATPESARLTKEEAFRIARDEMRRLKVDTEKYKAPTATYNRKQKTWYVSYMGKEPKPGNHCSISVDDQTGKARFKGGA